MLTVSIWNQITTEFFGRSVYGSYVIKDRTLTVKSSTRREVDDPRRWI